MRVRSPQQVAMVPTISFCESYSSWWLCGIRYSILSKILTSLRNLTSTIYFHLALVFVSPQRLKGIWVRYAIDSFVCLFLVSLPWFLPWPKFASLFGSNATELLLVFNRQTAGGVVLARGGWPNGCSSWCRLRPVAGVVWNGEHLKSIYSKTQCFGKVSSNIGTWSTWR